MKKKQSFTLQQRYRNSKLEDGKVAIPVRREALEKLKESTEGLESLLIAVVLTLNLSQ